MTAAAERKSPAPGGAVLVLVPSLRAERDDHEHPGADELDKRDAQQRVGEQNHAEPKHDCPDCAQQHGTAGVLERQLAAGERDDDRVVGAEQQVDEENLQENKHPGGAVDQFRAPTRSPTIGSGASIDPAEDAASAGSRFKALGSLAPARAGLKSRAA